MARSYFHGRHPGSTNHHASSLSGSMAVVLMDLETPPHQSLTAICIAVQQGKWLPALIEVLSCLTRHQQSSRLTFLLLIVCLAVWEVLNNSWPFTDARHEAEIIHQVALEGRRPAWQGASSSSKPGLAGLKQLAESCWQQNPADRPSFNTICSKLELLLQGVLAAAAGADATVAALQQMRLAGTGSTATAGSGTSLKQPEPSSASVRQAAAAVWGNAVACDEQPTGGAASGSGRVRPLHLHPIPEDPAAAPPAARAESNDSSYSPKQPAQLAEPWGESTRSACPSPTGSWPRSTAGSPNSIGALLHRTPPVPGASSKQQWSVQVRHHRSGNFGSDGSPGGTRWQLFDDSPGEAASNDQAAELAGDRDQLSLQRPVGDPGPRLPGPSSGYWD